MNPHELPSRAATPLRDAVRTLSSSQLDAATPCPDWDVRALARHLLFWGPSLVGAARKETVAPSAASEAEAGPADGDWSAPLDAQVAQIAAAWADPDAWDGTTTMGGPTALPAAMIGGMVVGELVVHGWDLARATGRPARWDDELLAWLHGEVAATADQGRELGIYGPAVAVPAAAPLLDRILGLTGRDPAWRP